MNLGINSGDNDSSFKLKLNKAQKEQLESFESVFDQLDKNRDGEINDKDDLSSQDKQFASKIKNAFDKLQKEILNTACEFSKRGIRYLLSLYNGKKTIQNTILSHLSNSVEGYHDDNLEYNYSNKQSTQTNQQSTHRIQQSTRLNGFKKVVIRTKDFPAGIYFYNKDTHELADLNGILTGYQYDPEKNEVTKYDN